MVGKCFVMTWDAFLSCLGKGVDLSFCRGYGMRGQLESGGNECFDRAGVEGHAWHGWLVCRGSSGCFFNV